LNPDERFLTEALLKWDENFQNGNDLSPEELCGLNTHLLLELKKRIDNLKKTEWMNSSSDPETMILNDEIFSSGFINQLVSNRYQLKSKIAEGGFAEVWLGFDIELHRNVAIKLPKPGQVAGLEAFVAEARRVARLKHLGIVPVYDIVKENDLIYIISEYVSGGSLKDVLVARKPNRDEVIVWVCQICDALDYAHAQGIIHRDIKPANILLNANGNAMIADFGIALSANKKGAFAPSIGTLPYMSPEHLAGKLLDARSDVYSVGVLFYELLNGALPYPKGGLNTLRINIFEGKIDFVNDSKILGVNLRKVLVKCLAKEPNNRFDSAGKFAAALKLANTNLNPSNLPFYLMIIFAIIFGLLSLGLWFNKSGSPTKAEIITSTKFPSLEEALSVGRQNFSNKNFQESISSFTRVIELDPTCLEALHRRAAALFNLGKYQDSIPDFNKAVELSPKNAELLRNRALPLMHLKQFEKAITDLTDAIEFEPATKILSQKLLSTVYYAKAYDLEMNEKYAEAINNSTRALSYDPTALNYQQRGILYFKSMEYEKAVADLTEAVKLAPKIAWHYEKRALAYEALGKKKAAQEDNEKAEDLKIEKQKASKD